MIQIHNMEKEGYHPGDVDDVEVGEESGSYFGIWTRRKRRAVGIKGCRVWVVIAENYPREYRLSYTFIIDGVQENDDGVYFVYGEEGYSFPKGEEPRLDQRVGWFKKLYDDLNNFSFGFSAISADAAKEFDAILQEHQAESGA